MCRVSFGIVPERVGYPALGDVLAAEGDEEFEHLDRFFRGLSAELHRTAVLIYRESAESVNLQAPGPFVKP